MKRTLLVLAALAALALSTMTGASANARWDSQVTGGGEFVAGGTYFDLAVSSRTAADGTTKGMFQYTRDGVVFHGVVDCLFVATDGSIAMSGHVKDQEGTWSGYTAVNLNADGTMVRVHKVSSTATDCGYSTSYPGSLVEGSFNMRL